jgi:tetratricopeptide (TPR) repeat protein
MGPLVILLVMVFAIVSCRQKNAESAQQALDSGDEAAAHQKMVEADQLFAQREDLSKVRLAVALLRQARVADYGNYEVAWKLAKFDWYLGTHTTDEHERDEAFREGAEVGKIAVQLQGGKPEGHFWLGANYGGAAENSTLAGLSTVEDIRSEMETVLKMDEGFEGGSAYLGLGQLYLRAPRVLGGDTQKAIEYFEKGLRVGGNNSMLRLDLAQAYHAAKRDADARKQIEYILTMTPDADHQPEYNESVRDAKKLLEEIQKVNS